MDYLWPCLMFVWAAYLWETYLQWRQVSKDEASPLIITHHSVPVIDSWYRSLGWNELELYIPPHTHTHTHTYTHIHIHTRSRFHRITHTGQVNPGQLQEPL